jgi:phage terminase Nu1 subunit (DNA packaging protein)
MADENILGGCAAYLDETGEVRGNLCRPEVIAKLFGVSVRRIQQLTQEGVIATVKVVEDGRSCRRYDLVATTQRYVRFLSDRAHGKAARSEKELQLREKKMEADLALRESQSELHRLKTEIASGEYISIEEVKLDYAKFFMTFKKFAMSLPARVSGMIAGQLDPVEARRIEKEMSSEVGTLLASFAVAGVAAPKDVKGILKHAETSPVEKEVPDI